MASNNNIHFQRPAVVQRGPRPPGMMPFSPPPGMANQVMAGRPLHPPQFQQAPAAAQIRPFPNHPFMSQRQLSHQMLGQGAQNPVSIGFPVVPQMGIMPPRAPFINPNVIPWGSGSLSQSIRVPGPFPNVPPSVPSMNQGQGSVPRQMPPQTVGSQMQGQSGNQGMTQALNQLVKNAGNNQRWSRSKNERRADSSSTAVSSSDNDGSSCTSSHVSESDRDRSKSSRYRDRDRDHDRHRRNRGDNSNRSRDMERSRFAHLRSSSRESTHSRDSNHGRESRESSHSRDTRDRRRNENSDRRRRDNGASPASDSSRSGRSQSYKRPRWQDDRERERDRSRDRKRSRQDGGEHSGRRRDNRPPPDDGDQEDLVLPSTSSSRDEVPDRPESGAREDDTPAWVRCSPADLYFTRDTKTGCLVATKKMIDLEDKFEKELLTRAREVIAARPVVVEPPRPEPRHTHHHHHHHHHHHSDSDSESSSSSSGSSCGSGLESDDSDDDTTLWLEELNRKKQHPHRLHEELWFNDSGEMNDGPLCQCSIKSRKTGIRHNIFPGEEMLKKCDMESNSLNMLHHYRITMSPATNFLTKCLTVIEYDNHEYIFEGFSLFSHHKLENIPPCKVIRFNIEYTIHFFEEQIPENFTVRSLDLFNDFLFSELLELVDIDWKSAGNTDSCNIFHLMPRFARSLPDNGKELLSMNEVLGFLLQSSKPLLEETELAHILKFSNHEWQNMVDEVRGMIVTYPGKKPSSIRIDQLDRQQQENDVIKYPLIIHFGVRPAQLSYAGDPAYQKAWKQYVKYKHLLNSKPKVTANDKLKLELKVQQLQELRMKSTMKREVTVEISSEGFIRTGVRSDVCQHAMLLPVLFCHLRFHRCLGVLEDHLQYRFKDRGLLQLALTHTSYRVNYGTNPDHARNSLANCGMRQVEYGDRKIHYVHTRKRGINILIDIMSRMGNKQESMSMIPHNERLEFLGDAVVEFLSSVHLFYMFPWLEEGGLSTYRTAIVQNQHLAVLAKKLHLQDFMLYAHGPDLCHESDLRHAMANCFEAVMGALFIDGGIELADEIFARTLFEEEHLLSVWNDLPLHPLQEEEPNGDRHWIESSFVLQKLLKFEESIGVNYTHIRLLAKAFTLRNVGYNLLTLGHNQRLEFLGDTVLQLVASEYLFRHFPEHHEGHLSLLRSSLVNNRTQSIVCDDLGMPAYVIYDKQGREKIEMKTKEKADLLEALLGALFVDKDLKYCEVFCNVCFFPRLKMFIMNQDWNDPKSQLQQCCLTLRELDGGEPDIPVYKVIESRGPTNTRQYVVAVYFRGERLATGMGHSIQRAEMKAATNALQNRAELFPILAHQKRYLQTRHKRKRKQSKRQGDSSYD
ncbi:ribonuclease 3-like [Haliotis asinina]|uniref:ribonuclease 3-like n=1 Tax=Haliotis asinina TaxID=109174 RepID=UPI00353237CA